MTCTSFSFFLATYDFPARTCISTWASANKPVSWFLVSWMAKWFMIYVIRVAYFTWIIKLLPFSQISLPVKRIFLSYFHFYLPKDGEILSSWDELVTVLTKFLLLLADSRAKMLVEQVNFLFFKLWYSLSPWSSHSELVSMIAGIIVLIMLSWGI